MDSVPGANQAMSDNDKKKTALEFMVKMFGNPSVTMYALDHWRLWWQKIHVHDGACTMDLIGSGDSIESAAEKARETAINHPVRKDRSTCEICRDQVDW